MNAEDVLRPGLAEKTVVVAGDGLVDCYIHGKVAECQDDCPKFVEESRAYCFGGAANAANCLINSGARVSQLVVTTQTKTRFMANGKVLWRHDDPQDTGKDFLTSRQRFGHLLPSTDAVYLADYAKGLFDDKFMEACISACDVLGVPVVCDPKRHPKHCKGAVLKCNEEFTQRYAMTAHLPAAVATYGSAPPVVFDGGEARIAGRDSDPPPVCINHIGAGDCFGAWLTLGLAHGLGLIAAARLAHAAGRVYVQHLHNRPPWPHEIRKELDPVGGKVLFPGEVGALRRAEAGRVVFTNGVYSLPHAGHAWLFDWAKRQGDVLVVGVNSNVSAFRVKEGRFCLPLEQRLQLIAAQQSVDYVVEFCEDDPTELMKVLKPDCLVKGGDSPEFPPGSELCEYRRAPESPFKVHSRKLVEAIRG